MSVSDHTIGLLRRLESTLGRTGRPAEAALVGRALAHLGMGPGPGVDLAGLSGLHGMERLALRLSWFAEQEPLTPGGGSPDLEEYAVEELARLLEPQEPPPTILIEQPLRAEEPLSYREACARLGAAVEGAVERSFIDEEFAGLEPSALEAAAAVSEMMSESATAEGKEPPAKFGRHFAAFLRWLAGSPALGDVRAAGVISDAMMALNGACEGDTDDLERLQMMARVLDHREALFQ